MAQGDGIAGRIDRTGADVILLLLLAVIVLGALMSLAAFTQLLYTESLRLRTRETPALEFFKQTLEDRIGVKDDEGALAFSLVKHVTLLLLGMVLLIVAGQQDVPGWQSFIAAAVLGVTAVAGGAFLFPRIVYRKTSAHWMLPLVGLLRVLRLMAAPLGWGLGFLQSLLDLGTDPASVPEPPDTAEHIDALISAGEEEGIIEEDDRKLIQSVVAFGDKTVRDVMTARPDIVAVEQDRPLEDLRQLVIHEQYSRIPVYDKNIDRIVGFVHVRDMFELDPQARKRRTVRELARPIRLVPETKPVSDLLREMQKNGAHMAIVVDEYGNTAGLATLEDLVEEILGEIHDEHEPHRDLQAGDDGSFVVSGSFDLARLRDLLDFRPQDETESTTIGGLVTEWLGRVPQPGEAAERDGIRIEVLAANELRVEQVRISRTAGRAHAESK
ncbi:MAG: hemolysin family protein [Bryobacteraceae bacterium]